MNETTAGRLESDFEGRSTESSRCNLLSVALNYGIYRSKDLPEETEKPRVVVFIDSGYSSTQVYAVAFHKQKLKVLGCVYDANLGGRDFDSKLRDHFTKEFKDNFKVCSSSSKFLMPSLLLVC